jgi:uncharacterized membrane protein (TIGR02234 family)
VCAGLAGAAALLWIGSALVWYAVRPPGRPPVELTGAQFSAVPGAVSLVAVAAVAAVVATHGVLRRGVGLLVCVAGAGVGWVAARVLRADPFAAGTPVSRSPGLPVGATAESLRGQPIDLTATPLLTAAGAALLLVVGLFVVVRESRLAYLGARTAGRPERRTEPDPDRTAWQELDAGRDPTVDLTPSRQDGTDDSRGDRAV